MSPTWMARTLLFVVHTVVLVRDQSPQWKWWHRKHDGFFHISNGGKCGVYVVLLETGMGHGWASSDGRGSVVNNASLRALAALRSTQVLHYLTPACCDYKESTAHIVSPEIWQSWMSVCTKCKLSANDRLEVWFCPQYCCCATAAWSLGARITV